MCSTLAQYAVRQSAGRRYPTEPDPFRNEFRRDIGRILYSKAFRRLAFKTQVFSPSESGDHYRNRLTHTLETAQIARVAAEQLSLNAELAEVIALAHDLGHPPFGHQGEDVLNRMMRPYGGFDHNLQNVRIVTLLEVKSDRFFGLNLTYETLFGIAKGAEARRFISSLYDMTGNTESLTCEARVADWADDLAYTATDFDDYARYHHLTVDALRGMDLALIRRCLPKDVADVRIAISMCTRNLVSVMVTDFIETSRTAIAALAGAETPSLSAYNAIGLSDEIGAEYRELNQFLRTRMYHDADLKAEIMKGAAVLETIFNFEAQRRRLRKKDPEGYLDLCDYISGMTDRFALTYAQKIESGQPVTDEEA
jgi:dGTPase